MQHAALRAAGTGRDISLSLSPGTHLSTEYLEHLRTNSEMWRVSDDLWDRWDDILDQFSRMARWAPFQGEGAWVDADMLPLGRIGIRAERGVDRDSLLTLEEQRTLMSLWIMSRSPLMYGGDLPRSRPETIELLTNSEVLRILNASTANREVLREDDIIVWTASATDAPDGTTCRYVAVFWTGTETFTVRVPLTSMGITVGADAPSFTATDLWTGTPLDTAANLTPDGSGLVLVVPAHGTRLIRFDLTETPR